MSTRKMLADSTQDTLGKKRKKDINKMKKKKNDKKRKSEEPEDSELLNLNVNLLPISGYIKTPDQMIEHLFLSVRGETLNGMLPAILKSVPEDELKKLCLNELEVMSKKRVKRVISGEDPDEISSSDSDDDFDSEEEESAKREEEEEEAELIDISDEEDDNDEEGDGEEEECRSVESVEEEDWIDSSQHDDINDGLDDVSSVESAVDFRDDADMGGENESECDYNDYLEIKPRPQTSDMEDGEVMSSGDENCDPTWRSRGEEEVERRSKELEVVNDADEVEMVEPLAAESVNESRTKECEAAELAPTDLSTGPTPADSLLETSSVPPELPPPEYVKSETESVNTNFTESIQIECSEKHSVELSDQNAELNRGSDEGFEDSTTSVTTELDDVVQVQDVTSRGSVEMSTQISDTVVDPTDVKENAEDRTDELCTEPADQTTTDSRTDRVAEDDIFAALNRSSSLIDVEMNSGVNIPSSVNTGEACGKPSASTSVEESDVNTAKDSSQSTSLFKTRKIKAKHRSKHSDNLADVSGADSVEPELTKTSASLTKSTDETLTEMKQVDKSSRDAGGARHVMFDESRNTLHRLQKQDKRTLKKRQYKQTSGSGLSSSDGADGGPRDDVVVVADTYPEDVSEFERLCQQNDSTESPESAVTEKPDESGRLEILELEMRARAIKAMLKAQEKDD